MLAAKSAPDAGAPRARPLEAFFLPGAEAVGGQRFVLHHTPAGQARGAVLFVHAFGEEMNKSRRMAALTARALAAAGLAVLQIDLLGCGDSSGDFGDATWPDWVDDVVLASSWLREHYPGSPLWLWGHRAGCLLAIEAARHLPSPVNFLLWQPAGAGQALLQQFLRLKMAGQMLDGAAKGVTESLKSELAAGRAVEVAGYVLSPGLAAGLQAASLQNPPPASVGARLVWLELSTREPAELMPVSNALIGRWQAAGYAVAAQALQGPAFWQTVEIEEAPALVQATVRQLSEQQVQAAVAA